MSTRYYLPLRHYVLVKYIVKTIITKNHPQTSHTKSVLLIRDKPDKLCSIVEFNSPAEISITQKVDDKINAYGL